MSIVDEDFGFSDIPFEAQPPPAEQKQYYVRDPRPTSTGAGGAVPPPSPAAPATEQPSARSAARGAGVSVLFAGAGVAVGYALGQWWGAGAGLLIAGAIRNGARAKKLWADPTEEGREEAASSATMSVVGGGAGAYLAYRAYQEQRPE